MKIMLKNKDKYEKSLLLSSVSAALAGVVFDMSHDAPKTGCLTIKNMKYSE
jgi:hypothetical protein